MNLRPHDSVQADINDNAQEFWACWQMQRSAFQLNMNPSYEQRLADLRGLHRLLVDHGQAIVEAINLDFGVRCTFETRLTELLGCKDAVLASIKELKKWMKPQKRHLPLTQFPLANAWTFPQPVGVVGVVVPWNFPLAMAFNPLIGIFAAGNRAMIKMSENANHLAQLLKRISPNYFSLDKLAFFEDGGGRGQAFTAIPFDHLFFTGSTHTAKSVMANAAKNLTPVTLELGGKSPAFVAPDFDIKEAASRILWAKMLNAGQICTCVDYLFLLKDQVEPFVLEAQRIFNARMPNLNSGEYTAIIDQKSFDRLEATLADAKAKGARVVHLYQGPDPDSTRRLMPTCLLLDVTQDMLVMQREIFGPLLPILTYQSPQDVIDFVNSKPRPLAFYVFSNDKKLQNHVINNTHSGGVGINEAVVQAGIHDLPFGGSGQSGMGHYHGYEGFLTFSKLRPVFKQGPIRSLDWLMPPYVNWKVKLLNLMDRLNNRTH